MKTEQEKLKFIEMRANNISFDKIAKELNISKITLLDWQVKYKREIEKLRYIMFDNLIETYKQTREKQIEKYFKLIDKINIEIDNKDFKDVNIKDLIFLREKLQEKVNFIISGVTCESEVENDFMQIKMDFEKLKLN